MKPTGNLRGGWKRRISTPGDCSEICRQATDDPMPDLTAAGNVDGSSVSSTTFVFCPLPASGPASSRRPPDDRDGLIIGHLQMYPTYTWEARRVLPAMRIPASSTSQPN